MRVGPGSGAEPVGRAVEPDHALGLQIGYRNAGHLRRVDRRAGMDHAANRTAAVMGARLTVLIGLPGRGGIAVTDDGRGKGIGGGDAGGPACRDRCENLHRQRNQDDWKKLPQPPAHQTHLLDIANLITSRVGSRDQVPNDIAPARMKYPVSGGVAGGSFRQLRR